MRIAFINENGTVQNVIVATGMSEATKQVFLDENRRLFGSVLMVEIDDDTVPIWSGGTYTDGQFLPPVVIEGTSEELLPPEVPSDSIPG